MAGKRYQVADVARIAGVTIRTLHHWDDIGLLVPSGRSRAGYRLYDADDLLRLQQICIGRSLGLSLEQVRRTLDDPEIDRRALLLEQRAELQRRLEDTASMLRSIDAALTALEKGVTTMNEEDLFEGFDPAQYEEEVQQRWGDTEHYREASRRTAGYGPEDWANLKAEAEDLMRRFSAALQQGRAPEDPRVVELAEEHRLHIDRWFYPCSPSMHAALASMYRADSRFSASFERYAAGLTDYVALAIEANTARAR